MVQQSKTYLIHAAIGGWAGMRGIVSLTAALALPLTLPNGMPLEGRDIVLFLTCEIIFLTLVIPGLTLPWLIKRLHLHPVHQLNEILEVRMELQEIAVKEIERLRDSNDLNEEEKDLLKTYFHTRTKVMEHFTISEEHKIEKARHRILKKQREHLTILWKHNKVDDTLMTHIERELDLEDSHLVRGEIT